MRTKRSNRRASLGDVLFGQNRGRVLALLYGNPEKSFYVRQIVRAVGGSPGAIAPELEVLTKVGLLVSSRTGNQVFYKANVHTPVFTELRGLVEKTVGVFQVLGAALAPDANRIRVAFIYGSVAKQQETATSDLDLMVVGDIDIDEVLERVSKVEKQIGRQVNPTVYSVAEITRKVRAKAHFIISVIKGPKIFLLGDENELGRLGQAESDPRRGHE